MTNPNQSKNSILHIGAVGTCSYINSKLLNEVGFNSHVAANDVYHVVNTPEWRELKISEIAKKQIGDDFFPNLFCISEAQEVRPRWYAQGPQFYVLNYLSLLQDGQTQRAEEAWHFLNLMRFFTSVGKTYVPESLRLSRTDFSNAIKKYSVASNFIDPLSVAFNNYSIVTKFIKLAAKLNNVDDISLIVPPFDTTYIDAIMAYDDNLAAEIAELRKDGRTFSCGLERFTCSEASKLNSIISKVSPIAVAGFNRNFLNRLKMRIEYKLNSYFRKSIEQQLSATANIDGTRWQNAGIIEEEANIYSGVMPNWNTLFEFYDATIFYGGSVAIGLLSNLKKYMAYEHGTIRVLPFENSPIGRLTRAGYEEADAVFITNTDYVTAKRRLEFHPEKRIYIPHGFDERPLLKFAASAKRIEKKDKIARLFSPSRQDWTSGDPIMAKGNHLLIDAAKILKEKGATEFEITMVEWGVDVEASKERIAKNGVEAHFKWSGMLQRDQLWEKYINSQAVVDQFVISGISGVTYEALALGCRIITMDDGIGNREFFGEAPPYLTADSPETIALRIEELIEDLDDKGGIGKKAQEWIKQRHSAQRCIDLIVPAALKISRKVVKNNAEYRLQ